MGDTPSKPTFTIHNAGRVAMPISNTVTLVSALATCSALNTGKNVPQNETGEEFYARFLVFSSSKGRIVSSEFTERLKEQCATLIARRSGLRTKKKNLELFEDDTLLARPTSLNPKLHQMILWAHEHALELPHPQTAMCEGYRAFGVGCLGAEDGISYRKCIASLWGLRAIPTLAIEVTRPVR